jgi:hypothetical protein
MPRAPRLDSAARRPADLSGFWKEKTRASPLPRVAPNWTRPTGREPAVLSSRQQGTEEFLGGRNAWQAGTDTARLVAVATRFPSSERRAMNAHPFSAQPQEMFGAMHRPPGDATAARN